ncbi:hypothetical protein AFK68_19330 [Hydrocoleum sp. CS-953]|nr:hypothetical protein AFK68_19330 [Hydrocoleum sp. CS-953]
MFDLVRYGLNCPKSSAIADLVGALMKFNAPNQSIKVRYGATEKIFFLLSKQAPNAPYWTCVNNDSVVSNFSEAAKFL